MILDPATNTDGDPEAGAPVSPAAWLLGMLQAGDSYYPTGSYAHSFGLEGLVQQGIVRDRETLRAFLALAVLPGLRHVELPLAAHAWRALAAPDWLAIESIARLASALKSPRELRAASENIGRQRAELLANLRRAPLAIEFMHRLERECWPHASAVSAALEGRVLGAPIAAVLSGVAYANIAAVLAAAMKILRLGQNASQTLMTEALDAVPGLIVAAEATALEDIGWFNPWLDIASAHHETADARLFIS